MERTMGEGQEESRRIDVQQYAVSGASPPSSDQGGSGVGGVEYRGRGLQQVRQDPRLSAKRVNPLRQAQESLYFL